MNWIEILGLVGVAATLVGVYLAIGPWRDYRRNRKLDDFTIWKEFARRVVKNYKEFSVLRYPYAKVDGAIPLSCVINNESRSRDLVVELGGIARSDKRKPLLVIGE